MTAITSDPRPRARANTSSFARSARSFLLSQEVILALALVIVTVVVGTLNPRFLAERNVSDVLQGNAYIAVAAIGMAMVIITGNIDISCGSLLGVLTVLCGTLATNGAPLAVAWTLPLVGGALVGAVNGFLVAYLRLPSIVVTLGMLSILKGGLIAVTGGTTIYDLPQGFGLAQIRVTGIITMPTVFMIVLTIAAALWMRYSPIGRAMYAVGGNADAARNSGINTRHIIMTAFILNGVFIGVASVLYATQFTTIQAIVPPGLELQIITAAVVGGVSILGGVGTVVGATLATILLNAIRSAMVFVNVSPFWINAVRGLLILLTVLADILRRRRLSRG